jgi:hypothetical protein
MNISFGCTATLAREALILTYVLRNHERHDIGIFNWIRENRPDGTLAFARAPAYVELIDDILLVRKMALPIPENLQMAAYVPPPASRVATNTTFTERLVLPIPILVMQPFRAALIGLKEAGQVIADKPATARLLRLEVGVFPVDDQCLLEAENPAHPLVFTAMPPGSAVSRQEILKFDTRLGGSVDVLDYRAYPWL